MESKKRRKKKEERGPPLTSNITAIEKREERREIAQQLRDDGLPRARYHFSTLYMAFLTFPIISKQER